MSIIIIIIIVIIIIIIINYCSPISRRFTLPALQSLRFALAALHRLGLSPRRRVRLSLITLILRIVLPLRDLLPRLPLARHPQPLRHRLRNDEAQRRDDEPEAEHGHRRLAVLAHHLDNVSAHQDQKALHVIHNLAHPVLGVQRQLAVHVSVHPAGVVQIPGSRKLHQGFLVGLLAAEAVHLAGAEQLQAGVPLDAHPLGEVPVGGVVAVHGHHHRLLLLL
mmetsp:Transcript_16516/g.40443  ORF Transcript_16516/g.40443 Transcript_16516/m.40443 type:complete len:221 (-) Transcript_16516:64-726(-)